MDLLSELNDDRHYEQVYTDITVVIDDVSFAAHRCVLGRESKYFLELFRETRNSPETTRRIVLTDQSYHDRIYASLKLMNTVINFMYTKQISLNDVIVRDVITLAHHFEMDTLKSVTVQYMTAALCPRTWLDTYRIGRKFDVQSLILACLSSFDDVVPTLCFLQLDYDDFLPVVEFQSQCMEVPSLFEVVMSWVKSREEERKPHLVDLFQLIDFESMDVTFLQQNVLSDVIIQESHDIVIMFNQILLDRVLNNKKFTEQQQHQASQSTSSSLSSLTPPSVSGARNHSSTSSLGKLLNILSGKCICISVK